MKEKIWTTQKITNGVSSIILWLGSVVLGLFDVNALDIIIHDYVQPALEESGRLRRWDIHIIWQGSMVFFVLVWISMVFITGNYQIKRFGEPLSWKLFAWVFGIEILILVLAWII